MYFIEDFDWMEKMFDLLDLVYEELTESIDITKKLMSSFLIKTFPSQFNSQCFKKNSELTSCSMFSIKIFSNHFKLSAYPRKAIST